MKKLIFIALVVLLPAICMSQSGVNWKKFIDTNTLTADSGYIISTSGIYSSWNVTVTCGVHTSTTSTVKIQVSDDKTNWIDYADLPAATLTSEGTVSFEDEYISFRWMKVLFDIESAKSVPINGWYVFKNK